MTTSSAQKVEQIRTLQLSGDYENAARASLELCEMAPANAEYLVSAALVHIGAGKEDAAIELFLKGTGLDPKNLAYRAFFLNTLLMAPPKKFNPKIRDFILSCLNAPDQYEIDAMSMLWHTQLMHNPDYGFLKESADDFAGFMEQIGPEKRSLFGDSYFTLGISYLIIPDREFEKI